MPDGAVVDFPEDTPREEITALINRIAAKVNAELPSLQKPELQEPESTGFETSNPLAGALDRLAELPSDFLKTINVAGETTDRELNMPVIKFGNDKEGFQFDDLIPQLIPYEDINREEYKDQELFNSIQEYVDVPKNLIDYKPSVSWQEVKDSVTEGDLASGPKLLKFMTERAITSLPDMAAAMLNAPAYFISYIGKIAESRARNDGGRDVTPQDMLIATVASGAIATAERIGAKGVFGAFGKSASRRIGSAIAKEGLTEAIQNPIEGAASALGTKKGYTLAEALDQSLEGAVAGGGAGGGIRGTVEAGSKVVSLFDKDATETTETEPAVTTTKESTADAIQTSLFPVNEQDKIVKDLSKELGISEAEVARELSGLKSIVEGDAVVDTQQGTTDPNQLDIVDQLETKQLEEMIAEDARIKDKETQRQEAVTDPSVRAESEFETARGTLEASQQKTSADRRNVILQNVVTEASRNPDKKNINKLKRDFAKALAKEGIVNTTPTEIELNTLQRATDVLTAVESQYDMATQMEMFPGATKVPTTVIDENFDTSQKLSDFVAMEAAPERREGLTATTSQDVVQQEADPNQLDLDLVARQKETPAVEPTVEPAVEPVEGETKEQFGERYRKNFARRSFLSANKRKKELSDRLSKVQTGNDRGQYGVLNRQLDEFMKNDKSIIDNGLQITNKLNEMESFVKDRETGVTPKKPVDKVTTDVTPEKKSTRVTKPKSTRSDAVAAIGRKLGKGPKIKRAKKETKTKEELLKEKIKQEEPQKIDKGTVKKALEDVSKQQEQSLKSAETQRKKREAEKKEGKKTLDDVADSVIKVNKLTKKTTKKGAFTLEEKAEQKIAVDRDEAATFVALDKFTGTEEKPSKTRQEADDLKNYTQPFKSDDIDIKFTDAEVLKIYNLVNNPPKSYLLKEPKRDPTGRAAAYIYFSKHEAPKDVLPVLAYDLVFSDKTYASTTGESRASRLYFYKTGRENAELAIKWLETNFGISKVDIKTKKGEVDSVKQSKSLNFLKQLIERETYELSKVNAKESLTDTIEKPSIDNYIVSGVVKKAKLPTTTIVKEGKILGPDGALGAPATVEDLASMQGITVEEAKKKYETVPTVREERFRQISYYWMETTALSELDKPVHPVIRNLLEQGNLKEALIALSANIQNSRLSKIALGYSKLVGNTKVKFADFVVNEEGKTVSGSFDPKTNTITLDRETGFNSHTILHEMTHALTAAELANPNSTSTKQLNTIFEAVKDNLGTVYGARNLDEFVAEARSNPAFRQRLAQMNPKTGGSNYLERFNNVLLNIIRRLLSMQTKTVDTALNATDRLVEGILSPSPESRNADKYFMDDNNLTKSISAKIKSAPKVGYEALDRAISGMTAKNFKLWSKEIFYGFMPLFNFTHNVKSVQRYIPMAKKVYELSNKRAGKIQAINNKIENTIQPMIKWAKKNIKNGEYRKLSSVILSSTIAEVKPFISLAEAKKQYTNPEQLDAYLRLRDDYRSLDSEGQKHYRTTITMFKGIYDDLKSAIMSKVDTVNLSPEAKTKVVNNVFERMFKSGAIDPYAPLTRKGNFWLIYNANDPVTGNFERFVETFEDTATRKKVMADINAYTEIEFADDIAKAVEGGMSKEEAIQTMNDMQETEPSKPKNYKDAPRGSFINDVLEILQQNNVGEDVEQSIMNMYIDLLPESSFAKGFLKRKKVRGFDGDIVPRLNEARSSVDIFRAYRIKASSLARQIAQMEYATEITKLNEEINKHINTNHPNDVKARFFQDQLKKYSDFIANENVQSFARIGTAFGFLYTLGANVSSATMNTGQIALNTYPYLSAKYGHTETYNAISFSSKLFMKSGRKKISEVYGPDAVNDVAMTDQGFAGRSIDNYDFDDPNLANKIKEFDVLAQLAGEHGQLQKSIAQEQLDLNYLSDDVTTKGQQVAGYIFHHSERFVRQVTLASTYYLELQRLKKENGLAEEGKNIEDVVIPKQLEKSLKLQAFNEAIFFNELSNGGAIATGAPPLAQGRDTKTGLIKIAFLFKRFGVTQFLYLHTLMDRTFVRDSTKNRKELAKKLDITEEKAGEQLIKNRKIARTQLVYTGISFATFAGVMGLPFLSTFADIFDLLMTDEDEEDFKTMLRNQLHALPRDGVLNYFFGVDFSSRVGLSDFVFRDQLIDNKDDPLYQRIADLIGGPVVGVTNNIFRGIKLFGESEFEKGILAMMPAAFKNAYKGLIKYPREDIRNKNYDLIYDTNTKENIGQFFGFAPVGYIKRMEQANAKKTKEVAINKRRSRLLSKYYIAYKQGDDDLQNEISDEIKKFNNKHPKLFITAGDLAKSMYVRLETSQQVEIDGVALDKKQRSDLNKDLDGWDQPLTIWGDLENQLKKPN